MGVVFVFHNRLWLDMYRVYMCGCSRPAKDAKGILGILSIVSEHIIKSNSVRVMIKGGIRK